MRYARALILAASLFSFIAAAAAPDKKTERTWKAKCAACHGPDGKGDTEQGKKVNVSDMTSKDWQGAHPDDEMAKAIKEGSKKTDKHGEMEAYDLSPDDISKLVAVVRTFAK
jgi:mono/diheme cytochrome c family protein